MRAKGFVHYDEKWGEWWVTGPGGSEFRKIVAREWLKQ